LFVLDYYLKLSHDKSVDVLVLDYSVSISASLVPGPALCPGAGAAERPQEILYKFFFNLFRKETFKDKNIFHLVLPIIP
jgi:hypothetical protein